MKSQKDAVYSAIETVLAQTGETIDPAFKVELSKDQRTDVTTIVTDEIIAGNVSFSADAEAKYPTEKDKRKYVSSMVGNWLTRDVRLTGGTPYTPENKGSRTGQSDKIMKNLKMLHKKLNLAEKSDTIIAQIAKVEAAIENRKQQILLEKGKNDAPVDWSALEGMEGLEDLRASLEPETTDVETSTDA